MIINPGAESQVTSFASKNADVQVGIVSLENDERDKPDLRF